MGNALPNSQVCCDYRNKRTMMTSVPTLPVYSTLPYAVRLHAITDRDALDHITVAPLPEELRDLFQTCLAYNTIISPEVHPTLLPAKTNLIMKSLSNTKYQVLPLHGKQLDEFTERFPDALHMFIVVSHEQRCVLLDAFGRKPSSYEIASILRGSSETYSYYGRVHLFVVSQHPMLGKAHREVPNSGGKMEPFSSSAIEFVTCDTEEMLESTKAG